MAVLAATTVMVGPLSRALAQPGRLPEPMGPRVGVWLTNSPSPLYYDEGRLRQAVGELADAGFNTLYPNVWSRGATFHKSRWAPMEPALAWVLGAEGVGLRRLIRERCDALVSIPMLGSVSSLNVSVAAGVLLYESLRRTRAA